MGGKVKFRSSKDIKKALKILNPVMFFVWDPQKCYMRRKILFSVKNAKSHLFRDLLSVSV